MKKWLGTFSTVWLGIATHKFRSFLTVLGIVIGIGAVITLMSIGRGVQAQILSNIQSLGSNLITIGPGTSSFGGVSQGAGTRNTLTLEDAQAIAQQVQGIDAVAPSYSASFQIIVGAQNTRSQVIGTTPDYQQVSNLQLAEGTFISDYDYNQGVKVAVLGTNVATTLFPNADPVGQYIRVGNYLLSVIGVLETKGQSIRGSADDSIITPMTALQQMSAQTRTTKGAHVVTTVAITVTDVNQSTTVKDAITSLLRSRHQLSDSASNDFNILSVEEIASTLSQTAGTLTLLLGAIAAISLLVGGIGVMNIMLVSVLERTREIGIRKALGARERDIVVQFLFEAILLTSIGGITGVGIGWGISALINRLSLPQFGTLHTVVSADIVILAVAVSMSIGVFFGLYPAWNASRLDPIQALRSE